MKQWFERHFLGYGWYEHKIVLDWSDIGVARKEKVVRKWMQKDDVRHLSILTGKIITYAKDQSNLPNNPK